MQNNNFIKQLEEYKAKQGKFNTKYFKLAEIEVLLTSITIGNGSDISVYPANCPGKGRKEDILLDENGETACMFKGKRCKYFASGEFKLTDYTKKIICMVV